MTEIRIYDSLQRQKVPFQPLVPGKVGLYVCGITPYAPSHIGHAYSAVCFDVVRRALTFLGYEVTYVRNVTDVEDKVFAAAAAADVEPLALAARFTAAYNTDMARFGVPAPDVEPLVSTHIPQIVALCERLIERGKAYAVDGDVYYEVATFPAYGRLSGQTLEDLRAGERVAVDERKRSPADFALWKSTKPGEPAWDSPWGKGRPGWHIECSAMCVAHLGETFDLHGGGKDLIFPHHENEIAQSQGAYGEGTFSKYWMHNGFLNFGGVKMSKSLGNVFGCEQIADAVGPEAVRFYFVSHHYRSPIDFDVEPVLGPDGEPVGVRFHSLEAADRRLEYFYVTLERLDAIVAQGDPGPGAILPAAEKLVPEAKAALADDFNAPVVMAALGEAAKLANKLLDEGKGLDKNLRRRTLYQLAKDLRSVGAALGVLGSVPRAYLTARRARLVARKQISVATVEQLIADRIAARKAKQFEEADALRARLVALGVELFDSPAGTDWRVADEAPEPRA